MDPLAPVLAQFRFSSDLYCLLEGRGSWGVGIPQSEVAFIHCVRRGHCVIRLRDRIVELGAGDLVVLPHGDAHEVAAGEPGEVEPVDLGGIDEARRTGAERILAVGGGGERSAQLVCGGYRFEERRWNPILEFLPDVVHVEAGAEPRLDSVLTAAAHELSSPTLGTDLVLQRLADLLLIGALRSAVAGIAGSGADAGWVRGLNDPSTAAALHAIHTAPERGWTLESLAAAGAVSTSTLTARFRTHVGMSPRRYLTRWRMLTAASFLAATSWPLQEVATRVGYRSDVAFSKAFKAEFGVPPGRFRRSRAGRRGSAGAATRSA